MKKTNKKHNVPFFNVFLLLSPAHKHVFRIMKLSFIFITVCASSVFAVESHSQSAKVSVYANNLEVKEVINQIESQTDFLFVYNNDQVDLSRKVSVDAKDVLVSEVLSEVFDESDVAYIVEGNNVLLMKKPLNIEAQQSLIKVTGTVVDAGGESLPGAVIIAKNESNNVATADMDGKYTITINEGTELEFSYVGYRTQIVNPNGKSVLNVVLKEDMEMLDALVVVGYGTQKKVNLTGAVSSVKMDEVLGDRPVTSVSSALQGVIPGLQVTGGNSHPGATMTLNIRGTNSINGGSPLILVDNMPMDISMLDPNDIGTINVLKDAAASAIYGARAAFGVILITTKQGEKGGKIRLNYSANFAFSNPYNTPKVASPYNLVKGLQDAGQTADASLGCDVDTWLGLLGKYQEDPSLYPNGYHISETGTKYFLQNNDRVADMMDNHGFQQTHNFSISGSSSKSVYRVSFGVLDEDGILYSDKDSYRRYNISSFISTDVTSWLNVQADIKYADAENKWIDGGVRGGLWGNAMTNPSYHPLSGGSLDGITHVLAETPKTAIILGEPVTRNDQNIRAVGRFILTPIKDLTLTGEYSFMRDGSKEVDYDKIFDYYLPVGEVKPSYNNSKYRVDENNAVTRSLNLFANYTKEWNKHSFTAMAGYNQEDYSQAKSWVSKLDMINGELPSIGQATGELTAKDEFLEYSTRSVFYRLNYSYDGKYLFETNGRYDGSSKFPESSRFGFFPSFSLAWRISEEPFMDWSRSILSNLKFRYSLGEIGNQAISPYAFIPGMDAYISKWLVDNALVTSLNQPGLVSTNFTWETVRTSNFGVDLGAFDQKLEITFDYYIRNTIDMLAPGMELPSVLGSSAPKENVADLKTKGWELSVNYRDKIGDLGYSIGFNIYDSRTEITKFDNEVGLLTGKDKDNKDIYLNYVGKTLGDIWGYETDRFYTENDFDSNGKIKEGIPVVEGVIPMPGDILYIDQNQDGIISRGENTTKQPGDLKIIGNDTRRYQYGASIGLNYKGFDLSIFMQGVGKRDLWRSNDLVFPYYGEFSTMFDHQLDYWTPENTNAFYPKLYERAKGNTGANRNIQSKYSLNGAYFRLKNVTLSYSLPQAWCERIHMNKISVFFSGEDLWTNYNTPKGIDPEINPVGGGWAYPNMRKFSFGINVSF